MSEEKRAIADWSQLPSDLLSKIAGTLEIPDRVRFAAVCKLWRSASKSAATLPRASLPWLLLTVKIVDNDEDEGIRRFLPPGKRFYSDGIQNFFSLSQNNFYTINLPETRRKMLTFSSDGWILAVDCFSRDCQPLVPLLLNPLTKARVSLPPMQPLPPPLLPLHRCELIVRPETLLVAMIATRFDRIFCYRRELKGEEEQTLEWKEIQIAARAFTYYQGRYFVVDAKTSITSIIDPETMQVAQRIHPLPGMVHHLPTRNKPSFRLQYFVHSSSGEELFLVIPSSRTGEEMFVVFGLDRTEQQTKWSKVRNIGQDVLFVDGDRALALPSPGDSNMYRRNCIVFLDSCVADTENSCLVKDGIRFSSFDIGNGRVEQLRCLNLKDRGNQRWFVPSLS